MTFSAMLGDVLLWWTLTVVYVRATLTVWNNVDLYKWLKFMNIIILKFNVYIICRFEITSGSESNEIEEDTKQIKRLSRRRSFHAKAQDDRTDRVYTVGCFDLFHQGHIRLLQRMRRLGKEVISSFVNDRNVKPIYYVTCEHINIMNL